MQRHEASNAASTQGGTTETPSIRPLFPPQGQNHYSCAEDRQVEIEEENRTLEDCARAIQRYREEYDRAGSEAAYDAAAEQAYREYRAQRAHYRTRPKQGTLLLPCAGIEFEREEYEPGCVIDRREARQNPVIFGVPYDGRHNVSTKMTGAAVFVAVLTLAVTPLLHACIFSTRSPEAVNWILSAESSAYLAAVIAWSIMNGSRSRRRLGVTAGVVLGLGLGIARLALWKPAGSPLFTIALASVAVAAVLLFAWRSGRIVLVSVSKRRCGAILPRLACPNAASRAR